MKPSRLLWTCTFILALAVTVPAVTPAQEGSGAPAGSQAINMTLMDCIREAFKSNKEIKVASYDQGLRANDFTFQEALFDAQVTATGAYTDASSPTLNAFDVTTPGKVTGVDSTRTSLEGAYVDPLHTGGRWSADLLLSKGTSTSRNALFPTSYFAQLQLGFTQPLLRNLGRKVNDTFIVVAANNKDTQTQNFRTSVLNKLLEVEGSYWTLVFTGQDLDVANEALRLAQELLKLNQIKVQVGTLPPIDITQAEAGVASREEAVITAQAAIENAADGLRRVIGMNPMNPAWKARIVPSDNLAPVEHQVDLDQEIKKALENRTDLATARLTLKSDDAMLSYRRNQLKYSLDANASYTLQGLSGDSPTFSFVDPNGNVQTVPGINQGIQDAFNFIPKRDFPTYSVSLTLGIPIGNRAAEAQYSSARLAREQAQIGYEDFEQAAIVQVGLAVRRVQTDQKRIQAAEQNRILQEKKVEAEQKKFENGMSTSFQVLTFQNDLADARSREIRAKTDYRISLANLDNVTGTLDGTLGIKVQEYARN